MNYTTNYNLKKPEGTDFYNVEDFNENADAIDAQLKTAENHRSSTSNPHGVTKSQVGLGNVPNVTTNNQTPTFTQAGSFANIVSGETLSVLFGKIMRAISEFITHKNSTSNPHSVTKSQVGLGNVDNTADADKPVSSAVQTALDSKAASSHNQAASTITAGTLGGRVQANSTAAATLSDAQVRSIYAGTQDMTAGTTSLSTGTIYFVYE